MLGLRIPCISDCLPTVIPQSENASQMCRNKMTDKRRSMQAAIAEHIHDGISVAIEGFTSFICFAAGHEIIRQRRRDLTLIRMTPDLIYDQMVAAGVASKMVFSYLGNPGVGPLYCLRRAVEHGIPVPL